jgi:hypothetical protein
MKWLGYCCIDFWFLMTLAADCTIWRCCKVELEMDSKLQNTDHAM